jgi:hypothetical protein
MNDAADSTRLPPWVLAVTMLAGLALLVAGLGGARGRAAAHDAVVVVNDVSLSPEQVLGRLGAALRSDGTLDAGRASELIDEVVLEELVFQEGVALGVARTDGLVRARIVQVVRDGVSDRARSVEPSEDELRRFYERHRARFTVRNTDGSLGAPASFSEARASALVRYRRDVAREALRAHFARLRERARVWVAPDALERLRGVLDARRPVDKPAGAS